MAEVYSAMETAEDELQSQRNGDPGEQDAITSVIENAAEEVRRVADEYREADEAIGGGGYTESAERAEQLQAAADVLEGFGPSADMDQWEQCDDHSGADPTDYDPDSCDQCAEARRNVWDELIDEAESVLQEADGEL
jgi:hypothetical protein